LVKRVGSWLATDPERDLSAAAKSAGGQLGMTRCKTASRLLPASRRPPKDEVYHLDRIAIRMGRRAKAPGNSDGARIELVQLAVRLNAKEALDVEAESLV